MEQTQRNLSSMVVRPSENEGGESDVEPGEVRTDRYSENPGYGMRLGSLSPLRHRKSRQYDSDFDHSMGPPRHGRGGFRGSRGGGRYHDISPPGRGRGVGRTFARGIDGSKFGPGPFRGEVVGRNNPNVSPREGDWICSEPTCGNLNFARRTHCNNCRKLRFAPGNDRSTRQGYPSPSMTRGSPPPTRGPPPPRFGPPINHGPIRDTARYLSPPRDLGRGDSRAFRNGPHPPRHGGRFFDNLNEEPNYGERTKFERSVPNDWGNRERAKDEFIRERRGFDRVNERTPPSPPPLPPPRSPWMRSIRERSRSPIRIPRKDYNQESYMVRRGRSRSPIRGPRTDYNPESSYMVRGERSRSPIRGPRKDYNHESSYMAYGRGNRRRGIGRGRTEASY